MQHWEANRERKAREGTAMHAEAERLCNGLEPLAESPEMRMLRRWLAEWQPHMAWEPVRTEWMLWWDEPTLDGEVLLAGTLDLLLWSKTAGVYALVDFKRTNPAPKREGDPPSVLGPCFHPQRHPGYAKAPLGALENADWGKYTMQLNILSKMLRERYGIGVGRRMYLLQLHPDLPEAHCVQVDMHTEATDALFAIEAMRRRGAA